MPIQDQIQHAIKEAMMAKDADRLSTLRLLKSAIGYVQIERKTDHLPDAEVIAIVQKEVKKRRDAADQFTTGGRPELAAKELSEISVLEAFLPQPLSTDELSALIQATIQELGATTKREMGQVIKAVQAKAAGRAEGKTISSIVGQLLP